MEIIARGHMEKIVLLSKATDHWQLLCARTLNVCLLLVGLVLCWPVVSIAQTIHVDATPSHVANEFSPPYALGSTVDRVPSNANDPFFKPEAIQKILSA